MDNNSLTQSSSKFDQIIENAYHLFMKYGIKRVSVQEICETAGVSKMTFYKHFKNKTDLAKALIERVMQTSMQQYNEIMAQDAPFIDTENVVSRH